MYIDNFREYTNALCIFYRHATILITGAFQTWMYECNLAYIRRNNMLKLFYYGF